MIESKGQMLAVIYMQNLTNDYYEEKGSIFFTHKDQPPTDLTCFSFNKIIL